MIFMWTQVIITLVLWTIATVFVFFLSVFHPIQEESVKQKLQRQNIYFIFRLNHLLL